jgi:RNA polymerase sigma factor (sigma-70 family)
MSYNNELVAQIMATGTPASVEENDVLSVAVVAGDKNAKRRMIEGNMPLVLSKVEAYLRCFPGAEHLRDDLVGEGMLGLCKGVDRLEEDGLIADAKPTGFLTSWIQRSIGEVIDREAGVGASLRTMRNRRKAGQQIVKQVVDDVEDVRPDIVVDPMSMTDLRDLIEACCESDEERAIVRMREEQYPCGSDREIAAALNRPYSTVYMMRREIYRRFLEKSGMGGEV